MEPYPKVVSLADDVAVKYPFHFMVSFWGKQGDLDLALAQWRKRVRSSTTLRRVSRSADKRQIHILMQGLALASAIHYRRSNDLSEANVDERLAEVVATPTRELRKMDAGLRRAGSQISQLLSAEHGSRIGSVIDSEIGNERLREASVLLEEIADLLRVVDEQRTAKAPQRSPRSRGRRITARGIIGFAVSHALQEGPVALARTASGLAADFLDESVSIDQMRALQREHSRGWKKSQDGPLHSFLEVIQAG